MVTPSITPVEARLHDTFNALMWSLSYPGRPQPLPASGRDAFVAIAETLIDLETSFYCPDVALAEHLAHTGARRAPESKARYHFYPSFCDRDLLGLMEAPVGTLVYPDESASLVIGCTLPSSDSESATTIRLSGPGVTGTIELRVGDVPRAFWTARERAIRYPLGWDVYLVAGARVAALPRTTMVEVIS